jgi:hypothetical protein
VFLTRFLALWHQNPLAPWPKDPAELSKLREGIWDGIDNLLKKGEIKEFGFFLDGTSGYAIGEKDSETTFRNISMFLPYYTSSVHEIIPYEKGKEILGALWKAQAKMSHGQSQR